MSKTKRQPLYESWRWMIRTVDGRDPLWDTFEAFVKDVSPIPENSTLRRIDDTKPFGPSNFYWKPKIGSSHNKKEYARKWRAANKDRSRNIDLKKAYGISLEDYNNILEKQKGACAICEEPETMVIKGIPVRLAVDHCHNSLKIRGLLCTKCNRGLGGFNDDPELLIKAAKYVCT